MGHLYEVINDEDEIETRECGDEGISCPDCFAKEAARYGIKIEVEK